MFWIRQPISSTRSSPNLRYGCQKSIAKPNPMSEEVKCEGQVAWPVRRWEPSTNR